MDKVLELLCANGRRSVKDLAAQAGISETEVEEKITRLEMEGVILGYNTVVDPEKTADRGVTAFIEVKITPDSGGFDRLARRISQYDQVRGCYLMSGGFDLSVIIEGKDLYDVASFVAEKLAPLDGVLSTATHFQLRVYKHEHFVIKGGLQRERLPVSP
jgi:DNA-binding Lrp family transcriptional regulator